MNVSEGRDAAVVDAIAATAGRALLDVHRDGDHHRSVVTVVGEEAARAITADAVTRLDLRRHQGAHPRFGVVDVVPFVPLGRSTIDDAVVARDLFCRWAADDLGLPCFTYGPERSLPDVRRRAFADLAPDVGPIRAHCRAGAVAVGARPLLVAYNVWLAVPDLAVARRIAAAVRGPAVRALGLAVGDGVQVSMNLIDPCTVGPALVADAVATQAEVARCELVGLVPAEVLAAVDRRRWAELDLSEDRTIEARLAAGELRP